MDWKLYYDDSSTYSSDDGEWVDAPPWGVAGVAVIDPWSGYERRPGDYYFYPPWLDLPWAGDVYGLIDFLIHEKVMAPDQPLSDIPPQALIDVGVKFGRMIETARWRELSAQMADDPDLPRKSTPTRREPR